MFEKLGNAFSKAAKSFSEKDLNEKDIEDVLSELEISLLESDVATEVIDSIKSDLETSIKIFKNKLGYSPKIFAYPFGEYSSNLKKIVSDLNFEFAFGQHSGVIDPTKDFLEMPRFPINEKYGELKRFKSILQTLPFPYKSITPENRYLNKDNNPPEIKIKFFENLININNISCYSNEGNVWRKSDIQFLSKNELVILLKEKFKSERGRINCSLWEEGGKWRWLGIQYVIAEY